LRAHTAARHEQLHHQTPFADIQCGDFGPREVALLERLHRQCWATYAHPLNDGAFLKAVGLTPAALFAISEAGSEPPRPVTPAAACGAAYVFLGSKFGGALLSRRLAEAGFIAAARKVRQSEADKAAWKQLLAQLEALDERAFNETCREADHAFSAFRLPHAAASF
jgi:hypothetical protein